MFGGLAAYKMNKLKRVLMNGNFETIQLATRGTALIALPNGNFVYGSHPSAILLNENFKEIKRVSTGGNNFCALNQRNEICVSVDTKDCIISFDLNLNQLKKFGSNGEGNNELRTPVGLCCYQDYLYICDRSNKRIQIITLDFEYVTTIQLDGHYPFKWQFHRGECIS